MTTCAARILRRTATLALLGAVIAPAARGSVYVTCSNLPAPRCTQARTHVLDALSSLGIDSRVDWTLILIPTGQFLEAARRLRVNTETAFTLTSGVSYLSVEFFESANLERARKTLAHEWGHLVTRSSSEGDANDAAQKLLKSSHDPK